MKYTSMVQSGRPTSRKRVQAGSALYSHTNLAIPLPGRSYLDLLTLRSPMAPVRGFVALTTAYVSNDGMLPPGLGNSIASEKEGAKQ
jgi:hypothetical protein